MSKRSYRYGKGEPQPRLTPPIYRWQEDMPENKKPQLVPPQLTWLNKSNDIWMEIPRYENIMWGGTLLGGGLALFAWFCVSCLSIPMLMDEFDLISMINYLACCMMLWSFSLLFFKQYFIIPRDQPIRLNRKRQKIFIFDYKRKPWNPWMKWPVTIRVFNWEDVYGELRFSSDRYSGGLKLFGSVCQPGTYHVIDRFEIATGSPGELHQLWSYLCLYMKHEPVPEEAVFPGRPEFWQPRKADIWPAEMERESTTAPDSGPLSVQRSPVLSGNSI